MTPDQLADICARAYRHMQPWTAAQFADTLALPRAVLTQTDHAFVLGQVVADEAEILALAADPNHQRSGQASAALALFHEAARTRGAMQVFLEVAFTNAPAIHFYSRQGYVQTGRRRGYYASLGGARVDAVIMSRALP